MESNIWGLVTHKINVVINHETSKQQQSLNLKHENEKRKLVSTKELYKIDLQINLKYSKMTSVSKIPT